MGRRKNEITVSVSFAEYDPNEKSVEELEESIVKLLEKMLLQNSIETQILV